MARYSIGQAEAAIAGMSGLSDQQRAAFTAEVDEAKATARDLALAEAQQLTDDVRSRRDDLLRELCKVRDDLAAAKTSGDRQAMTEARRDHARLMAEVEEIEALVATVEQIEADPVAHGDRIFAKYPGTRPNFTF
jgi:hypothetical protein